jgi:hypothetical protein
MTLHALQHISREQIAHADKTQLELLIHELERLLRASLDECTKRRVAVCSNADMAFIITG